MRDSARQVSGDRQITPAGAADVRGAATAVAGDKGPPGEYLPPVAYRLLKALGIFNAGVSGSRYLNH